MSSTPRLGMEILERLSGQSHPNASLMAASSPPHSLLHRSHETRAGKVPLRWIRGILVATHPNADINSYLALDATTGETIVAKQVNIHNPSKREKAAVALLRHEIQIIQALEHPNVVQYIGFEEDRNALTLFVGYIPKSIHSLRRMHGFSNDTTKYFLAQILDGLAYLASLGIAHSALTSDTVLVAACGHCKICGFEVADCKPQSIMDLRGTQSRLSTAPEVLLGCSDKADIWSVGCIAFEMWIGEPPWTGEEVETVMLKIAAGTSTPALPEGTVLPTRADDFRLKCFAHNPLDRPTAVDLRSHEYLILPEGWQFSGFN